MVLYQLMCSLTLKVHNKLIYGLGHPSLPFFWVDQLGSVQAVHQSKGDTINYLLVKKGLIN